MLYPDGAVTVTPFGPPVDVGVVVHLQQTCDPMFGDQRLGGLGQCRLVGEALLALAGDAEFGNRCCCLLQALMQHPFLALGELERAYHQAPLDPGQLLAVVLAGDLHLTPFSEVALQMGEP
jgi:hypothetical protein